MAGKDLGALYGQLGVDTGQWDRAMRGVEADLRRVQRAGQRATRKISASFNKAGRRMKNVGRTMNRNVTLPLLAAGAGIVKVSSDMQTNLAEAAAQADLTAKQVSFIGDSAEEVAIRTGESTADIIEAYKFTISAGQDLESSQEIVTAAAEASAAGFGKQADLVRTATTAMQAYSDRLDSGREFMDLLVGSAQVMELEVSKLSSAMQRNVGVADQLGIGMDELLGGIGAVSEIMGDANRGGRLFQTMITKLLSPTGKAKEAIEGVFGSLKDLHSSIAQDGLLNTMNRLRSELEANYEEGLGMVFSQRSLEAALNFTNNEGERTIEIMENMGDTTGSTAAALDKSASFGRNLARTWQALQSAMRPVGDVLIDSLNPLLEQVIGKLSGLAETISNLNPKTIRMGAAIGVAVAALGPLLTMAGYVTIGIGGLIGGLGKLIGIAYGAVTGLFSLTSALMASSTGFKALGTAMLTATKRGAVVLGTLALIAATFAATVVAGQSLVDNWDKISQDIENVGRSIGIAFQKMAKVAIQGIEKLIEFIISDSNLVGILSKFAGIDLGEMTTDALGFDSVINDLEDSIDRGEKALKEGINDYKDMEWVSISESAGNAVANMKSTIKNGLQGILSSTGIQNLLTQLDQMLAIGGPRTGGGESGGQEGQEESEPVVSTADYKMGSFMKGLPSKAKEGISGLEKYRNMLKDIPSVTEAATKETDKFSFGLKSASSRAHQMSIAISNGINKMTGDFLTGIGEMMAGTNDMKGVFNQVLETLADLAIRVGKIAIAVGIGVQGIKEALKSLNPVVAIAAGAALITLGSWAKSSLQKAADGEEGQEQDRQNRQTINDGVISQGGQVVNIHPNDDVLAMKDLSRVVGADMGRNNSAAKPVGGAGLNMAKYLDKKLKKLGPDEFYALVQEGSIGY